MPLERHHFSTRGCTSEVVQNTLKAISLPTRTANLSLDPLPLLFRGFIRRGRWRRSCLPCRTQGIGVAQELDLAVPRQQNFRNSRRPSHLRRPSQATGCYAEKLIDIAAVALPLYFFALPLASATSASASWSAVFAAGFSSALRYSISVGVTLMMPAW